MGLGKYLMGLAEKYPSRATRLGLCTMIVSAAGMTSTIPYCFPISQSSSNIQNRETNRQIPMHISMILGLSINSFLPGFAAYGVGRYYQQKQTHSYNGVTKQL